MGIDTCEPWECEADHSDAAILGLARRATESHAVWDRITNTDAVLDRDNPGVVAATSVSQQSDYDFEGRFLARFGRSAASILAELLHTGKVKLSDFPSDSP